MRPEDLRKFTRKKPFEPYRIHITDGQMYDIYYPDQVIVLRSRIIIGVGGGNDISEHIEHIALINIIRVEELQSDNLIGQSS